MSTLTDMIRGRQTVINLTNQAGVTANYGDVVVVDTAHTESFILTSTAQSSNATGVVLDSSIAASAQGRIIVAGYAPQVNLAAYASNGYFLETSTTLHLGNGNPSRRIGSFGQLLSTGSNPSVELWQSPDNATPGSPLSNPMTTTGDIIVGGASGTPTRLASVASAFLGTDASGAVGWKTGLASDTFCTGNVTMTNANTFYTGVTVTPAAGTYLILGSISVSYTGGGSTCTANLYAGSTVLHSVGFDTTVATDPFFAQVFGFATLDGSTAVSVQAASNGAGCTIWATAKANGTTNKQTKLTLLKIA